MKTYRCYNTKLTEIEGWPTTDKRGAVDIIDENNKFAFCIQFGKKPKIWVFDVKENGDFGDQLGELNVEK